MDSIALEKWLNDNQITYKTTYNDTIILTNLNSLFGIRIVDIGDIYTVEYYKNEVKPSIFFDKYEHFYNNESLYKMLLERKNNKNYDYIVINKDMLKLLTN